MNSELSKLASEKMCFIPIPHRKKAPIITGWQKRTFANNNIAEFDNKTNVGVLLGAASGGIVDIDIDHEEALKTADYFLPSTGWEFGRKSMPRSHRLYRVTGEVGKPKKFVDAESGTIIEYRADGQQTVFPPSTHPSGECIRFENQTTITTTTRQALINALGGIAVVVELLPYYKKGVRQDIVLALSGTLFRMGRDVAEVSRIVEALCDVTGDVEKASRLDAVRRTAERVRAGEPCTQWSKFKELTTEKVAANIAKHLEAHAPGQLERQATSSPLMAEFDRNDTGIAKLFAEVVAERLMYVPELGTYHYYKEGLWHSDLDMLAAADEFDRFIQRQGAVLRANFDVSVGCASDLKFLATYRNRKNVVSALKQARGYLQVPLVRLNRQDLAFAFANGLLDIETGQFREFRPSDYLTEKSAVEYDPTATCPLFMHFLSTITNQDEDLIEYMQRVMGYWLTGCTHRQEMYVFYGMGSNGKSTLLNVISHVLGPYCTSIMSQTLFEGRGNQAEYDLATLVGKRLAIAQEAQSAARLNSPLIKQLTGNDVVKARQIYAKPFMMTPKCKIVVVCNKRPSLDGEDPALKRRIKLVPFDTIIQPQQRDAGLTAKLISEASGIANWLVQGSKAALAKGIREPNAVKSSTDTYFRDFDSVQSFLGENTAKVPGVKIDKAELYEAYQNYCALEAMTTLSMRDFGAALKRAGYEDTRNGRARQWLGIELTDEAPMVSVFREG